MPSVFGGANVIAVLILLAEFGMFRQALLRDQIRLYAAQSAAVSVLAVIVAAARNVPELYVLAVLSVALKVVIVPLVMRRLLRGTGGAGRHRRERHAEPGHHRAAGHRGRAPSGSSRLARSASPAVPLPETALSVWPWRWSWWRSC